MQGKQVSKVDGDEIEINEIFLILWKRKWLIIGISGVFILTASFFSLMQPKIYKVSMVITPGIIEVTSDGKYVYLDSPDNIKAKIESNAYIFRIGKKMKLRPNEYGIKVKAVIPRSSNIINAYTEFPENKTHFGIKWMQQLLTELQVDYAWDLQRKKDEFDRQISMKENQIHDIEIQRKDMDKMISIKKTLMSEKKAQIAILRERLRIYDQRAKDLLQDMRIAKNNSESLIRQRGELLKYEPAKNDGSSVANLMYSTTIQQNVSFFNELKNQLNEQKIEKENQRTILKTLEKDAEMFQFEIERLELEQLETLQSKIKAIQIDIKDLYNKSKQIQNIKTISEPIVSFYPVRPKTSLIIFIGFVGGALIGIILAFILEYNSRMIKP